MKKGAFASTPDSTKHSHIQFSKPRFSYHVWFLICSERAQAETFLCSPQSFSWEPGYELMPHCCITLGHNAKDRTWIVIVRLFGNSCTARRKEHHSSRKGHTGGVTILSGHKQSTLCLHAHVLDTAMHRDRHLKACREKAFQHNWCFWIFFYWNILFLPAKELRSNLCALSVSVHAQSAVR